MNSLSLSYFTLYLSLPFKISLSLSLLLSLSLQMGRMISYGKQMAMIQDGVFKEDHVMFSIQS